MKKNPELSIVILSYNTKDILIDCLNSLEKIKNEVNFEVIVVDNGSTDGSVEAINNLKSKINNLKLVCNADNLGFAKGNNSARIHIKTKYVLFLNSDTLVKKDSLKLTLDYLKSHKNVGAITCRVKLQSGEDDPDTRRSFPTPWVALTHFSKLDRAFPNIRFLSNYWIKTHPDKLQEIEVLQGAFAMIPKSVLDKIGWFDESYFLDGEDIDLCWKIKQRGLKIVYHPDASITHLKGASKGKKGSKDFRTRLKSVLSGLNSMEIFYKKRLWNKYPLIVNWMVIAGINFLKSLRLIKLLLS